MASRRAIFSAALAVAAVLVACIGDDPSPGSPAPDSDASTSPGDDGGGSSGGDATVTCADGKTACGGACADLSTDPAHCGACGAACGGGGKCFESACNGDEVKAVATGSTLSCALRVSGSVWCWGGGDAAGLGQRFESGGVSCRSTTAKCQPVPMQVPGLEPVEAISVGANAACAVTKKGDVYCWGRYTSGELGGPVPATSCGGITCLDKPTKVPGLPAGIVEVSLGRRNACARTTGGDVWCWGDNAHGQLGRGDLTPSTVPVKASIANAASISVGADNLAHVCALVSPSGAPTSVHCWGANTHGNLGHANGTEGDVTCPSAKCNPTPKKAYANNSTTTPLVSVTAAGGYTCAVELGGALYCWGFGGYGVASPSHTHIPRLIPDINAKKIAGRFSHVCALLTDDTVKCLGSSNIARLGAIDTAPTKCLGNNAYTWPCKSDPQPAVVIGAGVQNIDAMDNSVVLTKDGRIVTWGPNVYASLGVPPLSAGSCPNITGDPSPCSDVPKTVTLP